jgi:hypothetical protein
MARAIPKYVFAALLALLSAQAAVSYVRIAPIEIIFGNAAEQHIPAEFRRPRVYAPGREPLQSAPAYISQAGPQPDFAVPFQRPPPAPSFFA